jgi:hypothetical protein
MFVCSVPRSSKEFGRLHQLEQELFGDLALPFDVAHEFFEMRPEIFNAIFDREGNVVAYTSGFPLRPQWSAALIRGDILELELRPHMIYRRNDCHTNLHLFIGSVVVEPKLDPIRKCILLSSLLYFRVHQLRAVLVQHFSAIMTAASKAGERLARRMGARKLKDRTNSRDGLDVFGCEMTVDSLARAAGAIKGFPFAKSVLMNLDFPSYLAGSRPAGAETPYHLQPLAA